jgi:exodeoxyribonuclease-1
LSFVFYDLETTGINTRHDQILQFAAIRTDVDLVETERIELGCRLDRHIVPPPEALVLTGRTIDEIRDPGLPSHYAMMQDVARLLERWSPCTLIGFNSIRFDEELLRHSLWRTLHNPYLTSWNNNVRADALTLCRAVAFFSPGAIVVPIGPSGDNTFRLGHLCEANGVQLRNAHAAIADAGATLELCRLIMRKDEETWSRFLQFAAKAATAHLIDSGQPFGTVRHRGNHPRPAAAVLVCASTADANQRHCLDLAADLDHLAAVSDDGLRQILAGPDSPLFRLRINACPAVCELWDLPIEARDGLDDDTCGARADRIAEDPRLATRLRTMIEELQKPREPSPHVEEQLYDDLPLRADDQLLRRFHQVEWPDRLAVLNGMEDSRVRRLGRRLLYLEAPGVLPAELRARFDDETSSRLKAPAESVPFRTVSGALASAREMSDRCPPQLLAAFTALAHGTLVGNLT